jgi:RND family efflux transporter MFP subunit
MAKISLIPKEWKKPGLLVGGFLLVALLLTGAFVFRSTSIVNRLFSYSAVPTLVQAETEPPVVEVRRGTITKTLLLDGELRAVRSRSVFASTSEEAKIMYLPPEGSFVRAGDRLVELDSGTVLTKIKDIETRVTAAENEIVKLRASHQSALQEMEGQLNNLWLAYEQAKIKARLPADVVPRREFQDRQFEMQRAKTEYENQLTKIEQKKKEQEAEVKVKVIEKEKLEVQLSQAQSELEGITIRAPSDGMVIYADHWAERRKIQIGDVVWGGFPLVTLPDLSEMEVLAQVSEVDGPRISAGQRAKIVLDSFPQTEISGSVKEIAQTAVRAGWRARAKIFRVFISMDKTVHEIMKPGMSAQVSVVVAEHPAQLLVPRSAVKFESDSPKVMRLEGKNGWRPIAVTVLASDPVHYAVADNGALKEGDRILKATEEAEQKHQP